MGRVPSAGGGTPPSAVAPVARRSRSAAETEALGRALAPALEVGDVVALEGPLGAGKTRFVAGVAEGLGAATRVRSPSFTLVHEYHAARLTLFHLDLYRLEAGESGALGLEEMLERGAAVVEWGERLPAALRAEALAITLEPPAAGAAAAAADKERRLTARATRGRGLALLEAWARATAAAGRNA